MVDRRRRDRRPYRLIARGGAEERVELHVLARAYRAAWVALHAQAPGGRHRIERLGIEINFGDDERAA
jgi:hypothetical protein